LSDWRLLKKDPAKTISAAHNRKLACMYNPNKPFFGFRLLLLILPGKGKGKVVHLLH
jgi:hypothetical protein